MKIASLAKHYRSSIMPSAAGPRMYENHIPSFMSVYDMDVTMLESPDMGPLPKLSSSAHPAHPAMLRSQTEGDAIHAHQHRESTSTQASDSTDSSPTTTISTVDSSSLSDPSPGSSPESPVTTLVPLSSYPGSTFGDPFQSLKTGGNNLLPRLPLHQGRPKTSPSPRKGRNLKSLALNLSPSPSMETLKPSETSPPAFIKPPSLTGKRKPSLLSLNTGAANGPTISIDPPGSPGISTLLLQRRGLKHSISSPQILSTPGFGPRGGMTLGGERKPAAGPSRFKDRSLSVDTTIDEDAHETPSGVQMATRIPGVEVGGDSFDRPHSGEDAKSASYPDGPILMYEPSVHLYLEPKIEEAAQFDVIINVAREVKNPFKTGEERGAAERSSSPMNVDVVSPTCSQDDSPPNTALSMLSFQTAFEIQPSPAQQRLPEYIHVPWDHNTDVKDELWDLCELIDNRAKEGKKVLVHCQQGASRSATLIIAYHMYKNQELGPNEAYSQAQSKSRWVNPNMSLLFSLNDFKKVIERKKGDNSNTLRKPAIKHRPTMSAADAALPSNPSRFRGNSTPVVSIHEPLAKFDEPILRPMSLYRPEQKTETPVPADSSLASLGEFDFGFGSKTSKNEKPKSQAEPWDDLMSPRLEAMTENPIQSFHRSLEPEREAPPTPGLFSPRTFEFPMSSLFPSAQQTSLAVDNDPRSPPTKGEAPIIRSIDNFL